MAERMSKSARIRNVASAHTAVVGKIEVKSR
jgi:hypothetical protein